MAKARRTFFTREGSYYAAMVLGMSALAMLRELNLLLLLAALLAGPVAFSWPLVAIMLRGLTVRRKMPREICAGDTLVVSVELANSRRRTSSWALAVADHFVRDDAERGEEPLRPSVYFPHLPAGGKAEQVYRGRLVRRGRYLVGPMTVSTRFPFGFVRRSVRLGPTERLMVFPRLGRLTPGWLMRRTESFEGAQRHRSRHSRVSGEFYGVRQWQHGDSARWIHWRSSAKHGNLVVRHFEQHHNPDVALMVDLWQPERPTHEDLENVELAVSLAATIVADICRRGGASLMVAIGGSEHDINHGPASQPLMEEAMHRLALVEASSEDRLERLLEAALPRIGRGSDVVLVSTHAVELNENRFSRLWSDAARRAALQRMRIIATDSEQLNEYYRTE